MEAFGDYLLLGEIGRGGTAVVWEARHVRLQAPRAIKVLHGDADPCRDDRAADRFLSEARVLARLDHESIVKVHAAGQHAGRRFIEMELVEGGSLAGLLADGRPEAAQAARWTLSIARALAYAHNAGVLHRDVKTGNVLVTRDGHAKLGDFGLARDLGDAGAWTRTVGAVGTPAFMAPEVARDGMGAFTERSDIYALGAVLYQMLTGSPPHAGRDPLHVLESVRTRRPPAPRSIRPDVPLDLEVVCLRCMEPDPEQRFASAHEVADELRRHLDGVPIRSRPAGPLRHLAVWARRHRALAASVGSLLVALVGGLGLVSWQWLRAEQLAGKLASSLALARLSAAHSHWEAGNNLRALADVARAVRDHDPRHDARRMLEHWLHLGAFVPPPQRIWTHDAPVVRAVYASDARRVLVQLENQDLVVHPADADDVLLRVAGVDMGQAAIPGFDGRSLLVRQTNGVLRLWSLPMDANAPVVAWEVPGVRMAAVSVPFLHWAAIDDAGGLLTGTSDPRNPPIRHGLASPLPAWRTLAISARGQWLAGSGPGRGWAVWSRQEAPATGAGQGSAQGWTPSFQDASVEPVAGLAFNPRDDRVLVFGRGFAEVWRPDKGRQTVRIPDDHAWVSGRFDGSGRRMLLSDDRGDFYTADLAQGRLRLWEQGAADARIRLPRSSPHVPDLHRVVMMNPAISVGSDHSLRLHAGLDQPLSAVAEHPSPITSIATDDIRHHVLVGCEDGSVRAWPWGKNTWGPGFVPTKDPGVIVRPMPRSGSLLLVRPRGPALWSLSRRAEDIQALRLAPLIEPIPVPGDGMEPSAIVGLDADRGRIQVQPVTATNGAATVLAELPEPAQRLVAAPNGRRIAWAGARHVGWVRRKEGQAPAARSLALDRVRHLAVAVRADHFWALRDDGGVEEVHADGDGSSLTSRPVRAVAGAVHLEPSGDGRSLAILGADGSVAFHDPRTPDASSRILTLPQPIRRVACSPGDARVAVATRSDVHVWDPTADGFASVLIRGLPDPVHHMAFHPTADVLAVSTEEDTVRLYSARTGLPLGPLWSLREGKPPEGGFQVAFSHDDRWLVGWSRSGLLTYLSLPHRTEVWTGQAEPILDLAVYLSGRHLFADGPLRNPDEPLSDAARAAVFQRLLEARDKRTWDHRWDIYLPR